MNVLPDTTKVSIEPGISEVLGDLYIVNKLLADPRYNIPEHLRDKVISTAGKALDNPNPRIQMQAGKLLLEADKRNLDLIKLIKPQKHEHVNVQDKSDEELKALIKKGLELIGETHALPNRIID